MSNQHTAIQTKKITLPSIPGLHLSTNSGPRKTPLELAQERRISVVAPQPVPSAAITRATIVPDDLLALLRAGPKTAAEIGEALGVATGRISRTLTNLRKKGVVAFRDRRTEQASGIWSLAKGAK